MNIEKFDPKDPRYNHCLKKEIEYMMMKNIDLSLNRSLEELESSYWEFIEATEGEDSSGWSKSVQENISALEGYLMKMEIL